MSEIKVGDELAFCENYGRHWSIYTVTKITPSGRIRCGGYELEPDLRVRGRPSHSSPYEAVIPTNRIRELATRRKLLTGLRAVVWDNCTTDQLNRIMEILREPKC